MLVQIIAVALIANLISTQSCLNADGNAVNWWVIIKVPPNNNQHGYAYYDSSMTQQNFIYDQKRVDFERTALTNSLLQINSGLQYAAWNDDPSTQKDTITGEISYGHSKGIFAYNSTTSKGFWLTFSIDKYPVFQAGKVHVYIGKFYGKLQYSLSEHLACFSLNLSGLNEIASKHLSVQPFVASQNVRNSSQTFNIFQYSVPNDLRAFNNSQPFQFWNSNPTTAEYSLRIIFKTNLNAHNQSIFEKGLPQQLNSKKQIVASFQDRLGQDDLEKCKGNLTIEDVKSIKIENITWRRKNEHLKFVISEGQTEDYACFGDLNRNQGPQHQRGGAFYCLDSPFLFKALSGIVNSRYSCKEMANSTSPDSPNKSTRDVRRLARQQKYRQLLANFRNKTIPSKERKNFINQVFNNQSSKIKTIRSLKKRSFS